MTRFKFDDHEIIINNNCEVANAPEWILTKMELVPRFGYSCSPGGDKLWFDRIKERYPDRVEFIEFIPRPKSDMPEGTVF